MNEKNKSVKPLGENVLVKVEKDSAKTKSGIYIPETSSSEKPHQGRVMAIGNSDKIKVKKGDVVIFAKYSGTEINVGKEEYLIIKSEDILAVLE